MIDFNILIVCICVSVDIIYLSSECPKRIRKLYTTHGHYLHILINNSQPHMTYRNRFIRKQDEAENSFMKYFDLPAKIRSSQPDKKSFMKYFKRRSSEPDDSTLPVTPKTHTRKTRVVVVKSSKQQEIINELKSTMSKLLKLLSLAGFSIRNIIAQNLLCIVFLM